MDLDDIVKHCSSEIKYILANADLNLISVSDRVEERIPSYYDSRITIGLAHITEINLAKMLGSADLAHGETPIDLLLVPIHPESTLFTNEQKSGVAGSFFYVYEEGIIKPVSMTHPIPLDMIDMTAIEWRNPSFFIFFFFMINPPSTYHLY